MGKNDDAAAQANKEYQAKLDKALPPAQPADPEGTATPPKEKPRQN